MRFPALLILIASLAANVVLWSAWRAAPAQDVALMRAERERSPSGTSAARPAPPSKRENGGETTLPRGDRPGSTWRELHSENLPLFVARLRAAGFPPEMVRAIVTSTVNERFLTERDQLLGDDDTPYWQAGTGLDPEKRTAFAQLSRERETLLAQLLGNDATPDDEWARLYQRRRYGDLPPEKIQRLQSLQADYAELRAKLGADGGTEVNLRARTAVEQEWRADLAKLLSPQELEQYELRNSPTANQLRYRLDTFRPSEAEYKTVFAAQRALDERFSSTNAADPTQAAARRVAEAQLQEQLKASLGPERYADYQQATNPNHTALNQVVTRLDLPLSAAREVVAVQQSINQRAMAVLTSDALTSQQQTAQLQALAQEATSKISAALTPSGLQAYQQNGGQWLQRLNRPVGAP